MKEVRLTYVSEGDPFLKRLCINAIELLTGRRRLEHLYNEIKAEAQKPVEIWPIAVEKLGVDLLYSKKQLRKIPDKGPIVFIANHPFGVLDGLALGALVQQVRERFLFPVNSVLCQDEELNQFLLPIDFAPTKEAMKVNILTKQKILSHLSDNGALAIFPAGGVATATGVFGKVEDLDWKRFVAKVICQSKATVVPVYFYGQNSFLFQLVSQFSLTIRLALLLNELNNKRNKPLRIEIGDPLPFETLELFKDRQKLLDFLKEKTFSLKKKNKIKEDN